MAHRERGLSAAEEAAQRRGVPIPPDGAPTRTEAEQRTSAAVGARYETKTVKLGTTRGGLMGRGHEYKKLEQYIADGWEVVSERRKGVLEFGSKDTYVLRRALP